VGGSEIMGIIKMVVAKGKEKKKKQEESRKGRKRLLR